MASPMRRLGEVLARSFPSSGVRRRAVSGWTKALLALCAAGVAAATAAAAVTGGPRWLLPHDLSEATADSIVPSVALDARGDVFVVWAQAVGSSWTVEEAERPWGGSWTLPRALSEQANHVGSPQVVVAGTHVVASWVRYNGKNLVAQVAERDPGGTWSQPVSLSPPGRDAVSPELAVDARGDMAVVWASLGLRGWSIQDAFRPAGAGWQLGDILDASAEGTAAPDVAFDTKGNAVAVWAATFGDGWGIQASYRPAGGAWSAASTISGQDASGSLEPQLAVEGNGDVLAVWSRNVGDNTIVETATRSVTGTAWTAARQLSPGGSDALAPRIAVDGRGYGLVVWTSSGQDGLTVVADYRKPGKDWGPPASLTTVASGPISPAIALDDRGDAIAVWSHVFASGSRIQGSWHTPTAAKWSAVRSLSKPGADALTPQGGLDADGNGSVVWARYNGEKFVIQAVGYDQSGPVLERLAVPARARAGRAVTFSVAPKDVWANVRTVRWTFGDRGVATGQRVSHAYGHAGRYAVRVTATDAFGHSTTIRRFVSITAG
jgi:PKD domain